MQYPYYQITPIEPC